MNHHPLKFRYRVNFGNGITTLYVSLDDLEHGAQLPEGAEIITRDQYTGMPDMRGREIYEQDVLKIEGNKHLVRVEWHDYGAKFILEPHPSRGLISMAELMKYPLDTEPRHWDDFATIVGNAHELSEAR